MKHHTRLWIILLTLLTIIVPLSSCQHLGFDRKSINDETTIIGQLSHGAVNPTLDETGLQAVCEYAGGQFELDYSVTATQSAKNVGFLLFLNGIPQPYQVNGAGDVNYMNMFQLQQDNQEFQFSFVFSPVTGAEGDTLPLKIYSIYYPQYQPDMISSYSYGIYHSILESTVNIHFGTAANPKAITNDARIKTALSSVRTVNRRITDAFIAANFGEGIESSGFPLENIVYDVISYNGETDYENLDVTHQESVHITYQMMGSPGATYRISLFANHEPLTDGKDIVWDVTTSKGTLVALETDVDVSVLDDFTTFYVIACPIDDGYVSSSTDLLGKKTNSILLYRVTNEKVHNQETDSYLG